MNIDGATGVVFAELGFPPALCRGLFVLSRSVGALAHAFEEMQSGQRTKAPSRAISFGPILVRRRESCRKADQGPPQKRR